MADKLTPQQRQAVYDRGGKLLVSAAAGSGKTKVLVDRLLTYLTDAANPSNLDDFLIITYTKAAAAELRGKIAAKLTERIAREPENRHLQKQMQRLFLTEISTVHGFCGNVLREYAYRLDLPADFRVADENECRELRVTVLTDLLDRAYEENTEEFRAFIDTQGLGRNDALIPEIIEKVYDSARCHLDPAGWLEECLCSGDIRDITDASETIWGAFLMEDLWECLDLQISVIKKCLKLLEESERMEKPAANLQELVRQMEILRSARTWDEIVANRNVAFPTLTFPRKNVDGELVARVKEARGACKKDLLKKLQSFADDSEQILADLKQTAESVKGLIALVRQFERDYAAVKRSRRILDFSDLEHKMLDLLLGKSRSHMTAAAGEIGRRYREILVDEYQDSNEVQDAIFSALTDVRKNCFLVGDVKQSIYQFRLADPGIFLEKYREFVPAENAKPGQGRKVMLSHNFRSGAEVIDAVNDVFSACMSEQVGGLAYSDAEALREGIPHEPLPDKAVELYGIEVRSETYPEEAEFVAERIKQMLDSQTLIRSGDGLRPVQPEDIVILLRSPNSSGHYFRKALEARGIRCHTGSGVNLLETAEVATLRALLQTVVNPRLDIPLIGVLVSPVFGFTADDLAEFRGGKTKGTVYDALLESNTPKAKRFLTVLQQLRREARLYTLTELLEKCLLLTRLDSIYGAMPEGNLKRENLQAFFQLAADYDKGHQRSLSGFLEHLDTLEETGVSVDGAGSGCVSVMSIHKSKGLEFPVVFLSNLSKSFNQESTRAQILCDQVLGLGLSVADTVNRIRYPSLAKRAIRVKMIRESISEEMRVLYVAMTRARDRLVMTYAVKNLQKDLEAVALRYDFDQGTLLCRDAVAMGDWVILAAMLRTEAGQFHGLGGKPARTTIGSHPWKICLADAPEITEGVVGKEIVQEKMPSDAMEVLQERLGFDYAYSPATLAPSKQTATDRKGRQKDEEAAENTREWKKQFYAWRKPSFVEQPVDALAYGNAIHSAMQHLRYESCTDENALRRELERLVSQNFLTQTQAAMVDCEAIGRFFETELGKKLTQGIPCLREFKFSILDDGRHYGDGLEDEQVLLQGVVDCALLEPDGITVIDFKTDRVTFGNLRDVTDRYRVQVQTYAEALSRIYEMPIKEKYLYFFRLNTFVSV